MKTAAYLSLLVFLERYAKGRRDTLLSYLSSADRAKLERLPPIERADTIQFLSCFERLQRIHYSWFIPYLETFAPSDAHYFASIFSDEIYAKLAHSLSLPQEKIPLTEVGKTFFAQTFYHLFSSQSDEYIPLELLPHHPLVELLYLPKNELLLTFDYLGLHDLSIDLKRILEAQKLKALHKSLSPAKKEYVAQLLKKGEPVAFKYLELEFWDGNEQELAHKLHLRGINRVSKALFGCHPSLLWHIRHTLDTGRAKMLDHFCVNPKNEKMQDMLTKQILGAVAYVTSRK